MSTLLSEESGGHSLDSLNLGLWEGDEYLIKVWSPQFPLRNELYEDVSPTMNCVSGTWKEVQQCWASLRSTVWGYGWVDGVRCSNREVQRAYESPTKRMPTVLRGRGTFSTIRKDTETAQIGDVKIKDWSWLNFPHSSQPNVRNCIKVHN